MYRLLKKVTAQLQSDEGLVTLHIVKESIGPETALPSFSAGVCVCVSVCVSVSDLPGWYLLCQQGL